MHYSSLFQYFFLLIYYRNNSKVVTSIIIVYHDKTGQINNVIILNKEITWYSILLIIAQRYFQTYLSFSRSTSFQPRISSLYPLVKLIDNIFKVIQKPLFITLSVPLLAFFIPTYIPYDVISTIVGIRMLTMPQNYYLLHYYSVGFGMGSWYNQDLITSKGRGSM